MSIQINQGTQSIIRTDLVNGTETQVIRLDVGSGTVASNFGGSIVSVGTVPGVGVVTSVTDIANLAKGTVTSVGSVVGIGTVSNIVTTSGTVTGIGTIGNLGSLTNIGTLPQISVGTIPQLSVGTLPSVNMASGTLNVGTATVSGNVGISTGTLTTGSLTNVAILGTLTGAGVVSSVTNLAGGTVGSVLGIAGGSITNIGSIAAGVITTVSSVTNLADGTVHIDPKSPITILTAEALGTTGGTMTGTLSAASGAGTSHYVTGLQIVVHSGTTDVYLGFGTALTGESVLARGMFTPGGGIMRDFTFPIQSGTNSEIGYVIAGAGTASVAVNYWKGV